MGQYKPGLTNTGQLVIDPLKKLSGTTIFDQDAQPSLGALAGEHPEPVQSPIAAPVVPDLDAIFGGIRREDLPTAGAQDKDQILAALQSLLGR